MVISVTRACAGGVQAATTGLDYVKSTIEPDSPPRQFDTVNQVKAHGGSIDGPGVVVAKGMVYVTSGYPRNGGMTGPGLRAIETTYKGYRFRSRLEASCSPPDDGKGVVHGVTAIDQGRHHHAGHGRHAAHPRAGTCFDAGP